MSKTAPKPKSDRSRQPRHPENQTFLWALHGMQCLAGAVGLLTKPEHEGRLPADVVAFLNKCTKEPSFSRTIPADVRTFLLEFEQGPEDSAKS